MKELKISNSNLVALVDDEDFERLSVFVWCLNKKGAIHRCLNFYRKRKCICINLAVEVMQDRTKRFDHKDRNFLNNQKSNLRPCTQSQNRMNSSKGNGTSQFKGVCWVTAKQTWKAAIQYAGKTFNLGYFTNEIHAAIAYNRAAEKYFGEFANLNRIYPFVCL